MRGFNLLPPGQRERLLDMLNHLEKAGWAETIDFSAQLRVLVSNAIVLVNSDQTMTMHFIEEMNQIGFVLREEPTEEGPTYAVPILEFHGSSVDRLYAGLDAFGILRVTDEWLAWFRERNWAQPDQPSEYLARAGVIAEVGHDRFERGVTA